MYNSDARLFRLIFFNFSANKHFSDYLLEGINKLNIDEAALKVINSAGSSLTLNNCPEDDP